MFVNILPLTPFMEEEAKHQLSQLIKSGIPDPLLTNCVGADKYTHPAIALQSMQYNLGHNSSQKH